jgi:hypothetical protein
LPSLTFRDLPLSRTIASTCIFFPWFS